MINWLVDNNIKGDNFHGWFTINHAGSPMSVAKFILSRIEKTKNKKRLILLKDMT